MSAKEKFMELVERYRKERDFAPSFVDAMKAVMKDNPDAHADWIAEENQR